MSGNLRIETRDRVRLLTLNRPEALNAFNDALYDEVAAALHDAAADNGVAVVVVTGEGRAFTAGQDLGELADPRSHDDREAHGFRPFIEALESFPKPIVAAVNGLGVGIGLTMLPHCDLVLISDAARLRAPFAPLGVTVEAGNSYLLPATVGWGAAAYLLYTGKWIGADEAVEIGIAWRKVPAAKLIEEAMSVADEIAVMPIASLVGTKKLLLDARIEAIRAARKRENVTFASLVGGPANKEAIAAFREGRDPDFTKVD